MVGGTTLDASRVLSIKPNMSTLRVLPNSKKTAVVLSTVHEPVTDNVSPLCTRGLLAWVLQTAVTDHGIAFQVGAELEFTLVKDKGDLSEGQLPTAVNYSLFTNTTTLTDQEEFISALYEQLEDQYIEVELIQHTESAPGQLEAVLSYQLDVMELADNIVLARETIRSVARAHKLRALVFPPKINAMQAGNGLHLHFSFRDLNLSTPKENALPGKNVVGKMSRKGGSFVEGILEHLPALLAFTIPSVNSIRRVGKGCWTGHTLAWITEDKEASVWVCLDLESGEAINVEFKLSDSMANIYLELTTMLVAGLDGIVRNVILRPSSSDETQNRIPLPTSFP